MQGARGAEFGKGRLRSKALTFTEPLLPIGMYLSLQFTVVRQCAAPPGELELVVGIERDLKNLLSPNVLPPPPPCYTRPMGLKVFVRVLLQVPCNDFEKSTQLTRSDASNYFLTRYDEYKRSMDAGYPRAIATDFPGIGLKVDAVFQKYGK